MGWRGLCCCFASATWQFPVLDLKDGILHNSLCMSIQNFYVLEQVGEKSFSHPRGVGIDWAFW